MNDEEMQLEHERRLIEPLGLEVDSNKPKAVDDELVGRWICVSWGREHKPGKSLAVFEPGYILSVEKRMVNVQYKEGDTATKLSIDDHCGGCDAVPMEHAEGYQWRMLKIRENCSMSHDERIQKLEEWEADEE